MIFDEPVDGVATMFSYEVRRFWQDRERRVRVRSVDDFPDVPLKSFAESHMMFRRCRRERSTLGSRTTVSGIQAS